MKLRHGVLFTAAAITGALTYANHVETRRFDVNKIKIPLDQLDPAFNGYKIIQISDIHMNGSMTRARLFDVVDIINAHEPDAVVVTGDFATHRISLNVDDLIAPLSQISAKDGKFATLGNHDYHGNRARVRHAIRTSGLIPLNNAVHTIRRGEASLHIAGVESVCEHRARLDLVLKLLPDEGAAILLAHEPDYAEVAAAPKRFALQLSGHSHGGQIRIPILTKFVLPAFSHRYVMGGYRVGKMLLYVNRGLGTGSLPLRFNCPPEISIFTLVASEPLA